MNILPSSPFATHPAYRRLRDLGAGRVAIEKIFDAFAGTPPSVSNIDAKLSGLRERGFADPVKMIVSSPPILGYAFDNIDAKLSGLRERGFADPVKMITSLPPILGYAFDNIDAKLRLGRHFHVDSISLIARNPFLLGYSLKRIFFVARIAVGVKGGVTLFCFLIGKDPAAMTAAASDFGVSDPPSFRRQFNIHKADKANAAALIRGRNHPAVAAYFRYRGMPTEARAAA